LFVAVPLEDNIFEWHFTMRGPKNTEFEGGIYHGKIILPSEYPLKPPDIIFLTPNGRFEVGKKICLTISSHHAETWSASWSVRTVILAIIGFFPTRGDGAIASLDWSKAERQRLSTASLGWKCDKCGSYNLTALPPEEDFPEEEIPTQTFRLKNKEEQEKDEAEKKRLEEEKKQQELSSLSPAQNHTHPNTQTTENQFPNSKDNDLIPQPTNSDTIPKSTISIQDPTELKEPANQTPSTVLSHRRTEKKSNLEKLEEEKPLNAEQEIKNQNIEYLRNSERENQNNEAVHPPVQGNEGILAVRMIDLVIFILSCLLMVLLFKKLF